MTSSLQDQLREARQDLEALQDAQRKRRRKIDDIQDDIERRASKHLPVDEKARRRIQTLRKWAKIRKSDIEEQKKLIARLEKQAAKQSRPELPYIYKRQIGNHSTRTDSIRLGVFHITVSHNRPDTRDDVQAILDYFCRDDVPASSHLVGDLDGNIARSVPDPLKAWTCAAYNSQSLNFEIVSYTDLPSKQAWKDTKLYLKLVKTAAYWSWAYDIPLVVSTTRGFCQHRDLGAAGGGHGDIGNNFPIYDIMGDARTLKKLWGV